jgi:hypothetical protein
VTVIRISLSEDARQAIDAELGRCAADLAEGYETGGWLWG